MREADKYRTAGVVYIRRAEHLGQSGELPLGNHGSPPQVGDVDVGGWRGHGTLQVVVVAQGSARHPRRDRHAPQQTLAPPGARLQGCNNTATGQSVNGSDTAAFLLY